MRKAVAEEFLERAKEEQEHADKIAERITQLDGEPDFNPATLASRSHSEYVEGKNLADMSAKTSSLNALPSSLTTRSFATSVTTTRPAVR
jgi:bacterioferritin (cytochrome b1)